MVCSDIQLFEVFGPRGVIFIVHSSSCWGTFCSPTLQSDSVASRVALLHPVGRLPILDDPFYRDRFPGDLPRLWPRKEGMEAPLSTERTAPPPHPPTPLLEGAPKPGRSPAGRPASSAASPPQRLTSRASPKAQKGEGEVRRNNTALLPRPAPTSALPTPAGQTLSRPPKVTVPLTPLSLPDAAGPRQGVVDALPAVGACAARLLSSPGRCETTPKQVVPTS